MSQEDCDRSWVQAVVSRARADLEGASSGTVGTGPARTARARSQVLAFGAPASPTAEEWYVRSPASPALNGTTAGAARTPMTHGLQENERLRGDLGWRSKNQLEVESDLLAVMSEWREKVLVLEDRLENRSRRHQLEIEELNKQMHDMFSQEFVGVLQQKLASAQRDLANALNLRESALSDDLDARDVVIKELGDHLKNAHESNQRMHAELQELQSKHHAEIAGLRARETKYAESVEELQDALRTAQQHTSEAHLVQQSNRDVLEELANARIALLDCCAEKNRVKRESEWAITKMTAELQRAQHALAAFEVEMQEADTFSASLKQPPADNAATTQLSRELEMERQRAASLAQQTEALQLELKRKVLEIGHLRASLLSDSSSQALSADETQLAFSPARGRHAEAASQSESSVHLGNFEQQLQAMATSHVAALRSSLETKDRECIELRSALDVLW